MTAGGIRDAARSSLSAVARTTGGANVTDETRLSTFRPVRFARAREHIDPVSDPRR
jgi:hypothetical protein